MPADRGFVRAAWFGAAAFAVAALVTLFAVANRSSQVSFIGTPVLLKGLDRFIEPGVTAWWLTVGATFQAWPTGAAGFAVLVVSNALFWALVALLLRALLGRLWRGLKAGHDDAGRGT